MPTKKRFTDDSYRKEPWFKALTQALLSCNMEEGMMDLLRDLGTLSELQAWSERLEVAKQLAKGLSYREVAALTGASTTTVTRVAKFIENGPGGYRALLHVHRHHRLLVKKETENRIISGAQEKAKKPEQISVLQKYLSRTDSPAAP